MIKVQKKRAINTKIQTKEVEKEAYNNNNTEKLRRYV